MRHFPRAFQRQMFAVQLPSSVFCYTFCCCQAHFDHFCIFMFLNFCICFYCEFVFVIVLVRLLLSVLNKTIKLLAEVFRAQHLCYDELLKSHSGPHCNYKELYVTYYVNRKSRWTTVTKKSVRSFVISATFGWNGWRNRCSFAKWIEIMMTSYGWLSGKTSFPDWTASAILSPRSWTLSKGDSKKHKA